MKTCYECGAVIQTEEFSGKDSEGRPLCTRCEEARHPLLESGPLTWGKFHRSRKLSRSPELRAKMEPVFFSRETERERIIASFTVFSVPSDVRTMIMEALDSPLWDWFVNCDGCTCVSEEYWPTNYFPPCLVHDFDCYTGRDWGFAADRFYRLQRIYGIPRWAAGLRWAGVWVGYWAWYKWARMIKEP